MNMEWGLQGEMRSRLGIQQGGDDDDDGSLVARNTNTNTINNNTNNKRSEPLAAYGHQLHHQQQQNESIWRSTDANLFDGDDSGSADAENEENDDDDDLDRLGVHSRNNKKKKMRHTPHQIQELETLFKECPHPDEKQRMEVSQRLSLDSRQVKFWFQNRRTQMKTKMERHENSILMQENEKLRVENMSLKEAMRSPICINCGAPSILAIDETSSLDMQHLLMENSRLRDELDRVYALANKFLGGTVLKW